MWSQSVRQTDLETNKLIGKCWLALAACSIVSLGCPLALLLFYMTFCSHVCYDQLHSPRAKGNTALHLIIITIVMCLENEPRATEL